MIKSHFNEIYKVRVYFAWDCDFKEASKACKLIGKDLSKESYIANSATTYANDYQEYLILFRKKFHKNCGVVAHEVFHLVNFILRDKGFSLSDDSDEAYAYLIEYYTNWFLDQTKKKRNK